MTRFIVPAVTAMLLIAAPVYAQAPGIIYGDEDSDFWEPPERITCMTTRQVRDFVAAQGFTDVYLNAPMAKNVEVRATMDGWVYLLDFNFCRGYIESVQQLRPAQ